MWYSVHRQWGFPYSVVLCGNLTIPNYEKNFHCFLFVAKVKLRHSPGRPSRSDFVQFEVVRLSSNITYYRISSQILVCQNNIGVSPYIIILMIPITTRCAG